MVPDGAVIAVTSHGRSTTVTVRAFPEVLRLDQVAALKPLLADLRTGRLDIAAADRRLTVIRTAPPPYRWWLRMLGIVLFSVGFAPLMQPTWYEVGTTAVLATVCAALAIAAERVPRLAAVLPLAAAPTISLITLVAFAPEPPPTAGRCC